MNRTVRRAVTAAVLTPLFCVGFTGIASARPAATRVALPDLVCSGISPSPKQVELSGAPKATRAERSPTYYSVSSKKVIYIRAKDGRIYGQKGVTLGIAKGTSWTIGGSVTGTVKAEAGVIFAKAETSLAITVSLSRTTTTTFSGSWTVPKSQSVGWLEVGTNQGYSFKWTKYHYNAPCTKVVEGSGTAKVPAKKAALMFKHS